MKDLVNKDKIYLEDFDVYVNPYLTYAQIQQIVDGISTLSTWSEKKTSLDMLVLYHVTDIGQEKLEKYTHNQLLESGLIDKVFQCIENIDQLYKAIQWTSGETYLERLLGNFIQQMNAITASALENVQKEVKKNGKQSNK